MSHLEKYESTFTGNFYGSSSDLLRVFSMGIRKRSDGDPMEIRKLRPSMPFKSG
ncbi:hypothetical protein ACFRAE_14280 [Sphingobacterium sp. HJSM2_6]|uniref:hypothetical protein n=1 Tax=Sphingobacterium sp. HJSM2_6 TaxID=3366264 RepID=UPI003BC13500